MDKTAAKQVQQICRMMPRNAFQKIEQRNKGSRRNMQWANVEKAFKQHCNLATRAVVTPNPDPALLQTVDPAWSQNILDRVQQELVAVGGSTRKRQRQRHLKTRRTKRV
jgi:hypothetical protein